jgi:hypothetical protein
MIETMKYKPHRFAKLVPEPTAQELEELTNDIKEHGLQEPIVIFEGEVLDGRSRQKACHKAGLIPLTRTFNPAVEGDPLAFVVSMNFRRRQLQMTPGEKAAYVAEHILPVFEEQAKERQKAGKAPTLAPNGDKVLPAGGEEVKPGKKAQVKRGQKATQQAARVSGVSARSIERAKAKLAGGKLTAKERDEKERADALARIEKALGKDAPFFTATRAKGQTHGTGPQTLKKTRPLVAFSKLDKDKMRKVEGLLLSSTMSLAEAVRWNDRKKITERSLLRDLFYLAAANRFELFTTVDGWTVEIYREGSKK